MYSCSSERYSLYVLPVNIIATALDLYFIYSLQFKLLTVDQIQYLSSLCSFLLSGRVYITLNNLSDKLDSQ